MPKISRLKGIHHTHKGVEIHTGDTFWADSVNGSDDNDGKSPDTAKANVFGTSGAYAQTAAGNGDVVYVMERHSETISAAQTLDKNDVSIIGVGGRNRPQLLFDTVTTSALNITGADMTIEGLLFGCNIASQAAMIDFQAAGRGGVVRDCVFTENTAVGLGFILLSAATANDVCIEECTFYAPSASTQDYAIRIGAAMAGVKIQNNYIFGDFDDAGIHNPTGNVATQIIIRNNQITNLQTGDHAIELVSAVTGMITDNRLFGDTRGSVLDPGSCYCAGNLAVYGIDQNAVPVPDTPGLNWQVARHASSAFDGGTLNAHGDQSGTGNPYTVFTVTGDVVVQAIWGVVNTDLVGATATVEVGTANNTAGLLFQATATDLDDGDIYVDATSALEVNLVTADVMYMINDGADIVETTGTADITAGQIDYYCIWAPAEEGALIVSA